MIPVDPDLGRYDRAVLFDRDNGSHTEARLGYCRVYNSEVSFQFEPITYVPGINREAKYSVAVTQSGAEVSEFRDFFKKGL